MMIHLLSNDLRKQFTQVGQLQKLKNLVRQYCLGSELEEDINSVHGLYTQQDQDAYSCAKIYNMIPQPQDQQEKQLFEQANSFIHRVSEYGHYSLICGGWVRDNLLNRPCTDIDVATSAKPFLIRKLYRNVATTKKTVIVRTDVDITKPQEELEQQVRLEVTPFRGESDTRGAEAAKLDAFKREFTINSLFYDPIKKEIVDFVGGVRDLENRCLRCPSDPHKILRDDPIRCMRAVRFAAYYSLQIEEATQAGIRENSHLCNPSNSMDVSRILREFEKWEKLEQLSKGMFASALQIAKDVGLLKHILPPNHEDPEWQEGFQKGLRLLSRLPQITPAELMICSLFPPDITLLYRLRTFYKLNYSYARYYNTLTMENFTYLVKLSEKGTPAEDKEWASFYARRYSQICVVIYCGWLPQGKGEQFLQFNIQNRQRLSNLIEIESQLLLADYNMQKQGLCLKAEFRKKTLDEVRQLMVKNRVSGEEALKQIQQSEDWMKQLQPKQFIRRTRS